MEWNRQTKVFFGVGAALLMVFAGCVAHSGDAEKKFTQGWEDVTQHGTVVGTGVIDVLPNQGVDVTPFSLTYDCYQQGVQDQDENGVLITGVPATFEDYDAIMAGELTAEEYADKYTDDVVADATSQDNWNIFVEDILTNLEEADEDQYETAEQWADEKLDKDLSNLNENTVEEFYRAQTHWFLENRVYTALEQSLAPFEENQISFQENVVDVDKATQMIAAFNELATEDTERFETILADGELTFEEVEDKVDEDFSISTCAPAGMIWTDPNAYFGGDRADYAMDEVILPIDAPTFSSEDAGDESFHDPDLPLRAERAQASTDGDIEFTGVTVDAPGLVVTGDQLKTPLLGHFSSYQEVTKNVIGLDLGFEEAEVTVTEHSPWGDESTTSTVGGNADITEAGEIVIPLVEIPVESQIAPQDEWALRNMETSIEVVDDDSNHEGEDGVLGQPGTLHWTEAKFGLSQDGIGFETSSIELHTPLNVVLAAEYSSGVSAPTDAEAPCPDEGDEACGFINQAVDNVQEQAEIIEDDARQAFEDATGEELPEAPDGDDLPGAPGTDADTDTSPSILWAQATWGSEGIDYTSIADPVSMAEHIANACDGDIVEGDETGLTALRDCTNTVAFVNPSPQFAPLAEDFRTLHTEAGIGIFQDADAYATAPITDAQGTFVGANSPDYAVGAPDGDLLTSTNNVVTTADYRGDTLVAQDDLIVPAGDAVATTNEERSGLFTPVEDPTMAQATTLDAGTNVIGTVSDGLFETFQEEDDFVVALQTEGGASLTATDLQSSVAVDDGWAEASGQTVANSGFTLSAGIFVK